MVLCYNTLGNTTGNELVGTNYIPFSQLGGLHLNLTSHGTETSQPPGAGQLTFPYITCLKQLFVSCFTRCSYSPPIKRSSKRRRSCPVGAQSQNECHYAQAKHRMLRTREMCASCWPATHECQPAPSDTTGSWSKPFAGHMMNSKQSDIPFTHWVTDRQCGSTKPISLSHGAWLWNWLLFTSNVALGNVLTSLALVSLSIKWR